MISRPYAASAQIDSHFVSIIITQRIKASLYHSIIFLILFLHIFIKQSAPDFSSPERFPPSFCSHLCLQLHPLAPVNSRSHPTFSRAFSSFTLAAAFPLFSRPLYRIHEVSSSTALSTRFFPPDERKEKSPRLCPR